jgi:amino acid adenylation domain-containing protein
MAIEGQGLSLSYEALNQTANRLARAILAHCPPGAGQVGLLFEQGPAALVAMLAALKAGKAYVPLDPTFPQARTAYILEDSQAELLLTNQENRSLAAQLARGPCRVFNTDDLDPALPGANLGRAISPETVAYILYTSGSTGQPKGVVQTHRNLLHFVHSYTTNLRITAADRLSLFYSFSFSASLMDIYGALLTGATVLPYNVKAEGVARLSDWLREKHITVFHSVPTLWRHWLESLDPEHTFPSLRLIVLGGEPVYQRDVQMHRKHLGPTCVLVNHLALTEASVVAQLLIGPDAEVAGPYVPVGYPAKGVEILLLDEQGQPVVEGTMGEMVVQSPFLSVGYWQKPDLTRTAFRTGPDGARQFHTGDLGRRNAAGLLEHLGRKDFRVKIRGYSVEVGEVEAALLNLRSVQEAIVAAQADASGEQRLVAYLVARKGRPLDPRELRRQLARTLPDYMIPSAFIPLPALPLTPTGKVDRRALPAWQPAAPDSARAYEAPATALEELLIRLWEEILGIKPIGVTDDFFALGGTSLQAADLFVRIQRTLGKTLPLATILENPTIRHLALAVRRQDPSRRRTALVTIQGGGSKPPLFCVHCGRGSVFHYYELARYLGPDQPVYGLQPPGMGGGQGFDRIVPAMAARYVREIRVVWPRGPYLLCGFSFGGIVAFEMALQLRQQGCPAIFVGLLDTSLPWLGSVGSAAMKTRRHLENLAKLGMRQKLWYLARSAFGNFRTLVVRGMLHARRLPEFPKMFRCRLALALGRTLPLSLEDYYYYRQVAGPSRSAYLPQVFAGRVTLFRAGESYISLPEPVEPDLGWGRFAGGGLVIVDMPWMHGDMLKEPVVQLLAERLKECLEETCNAPDARGGAHAEDKDNERGRANREREPMFQHSRPEGNDR